MAFQIKAHLQLQHCELLPSANEYDDYKIGYNLQVE